MTGPERPDHATDPTGRCVDCGEPWPCPTLKTAWDRVDAEILAALIEVST